VVEQRTIIGAPNRALKRRAKRGEVAMIDIGSDNFVLAQMIESCMTAEEAACSEEPSLSGGFKRKVQR
jgi:hypothetical protein